MLNSINIEDIKPLGEKAIDLFIESWSNSARIVQVRGLTKNEIISGDHTTNGDRSLASQSISITEIPLSVAVKVAATDVKRGECFVRISLRIEGQVIAILSAGYVSSTNGLNHPNGRIEGSTEGPGLIRTITGTNPAAGVEISETVPTGARWKLKTIRAPFATDATVANRVVLCILTDGTNIISETTPNYLQTASRLINYTFGLILQVTAAGGNNYNIAPLPVMKLGAGYKITTSVLNLQAGDNWGAPQLVVEEWIEV